VRGGEEEEPEEGKLEMEMSKSSGLFALLSNEALTGRGAIGEGEDGCCLLPEQACSATDSCEWKS
jgi:hypothetical protein